MLRTLLKNMQHWLKELKEVATQRRQRRLAEIAEIEKRERKALVKELAKKFAAAHADCEQNDKPFTMIELSLKEITFIEWYLTTWSRHLRESQIFAAAPQR